MANLSIDSGIIGEYTPHGRMDIPAGERSRRQGSDILGGQTPAGTSGVWPSKASEQGDVDTLAVRLRKARGKAALPIYMARPARGRGLQTGEKGITGKP